MLISSKEQGFLQKFVTKHSAKLFVIGPLYIKINYRFVLFFVNSMFYVVV